MDIAQAEKIAVEVLSWMVSDDDIIGGFLGVTGASPEDLRDQAKDPEFLGFVLDYLLSDDDMVLNYAQANNRNPTDPMMARAALPGGQDPNWT